MIATRPIHERVDRAVDDIFFRRRHEAERALRRFARDVAYIDDATTAIERTVDTVARAIDARCAVFIAQVDDSFARADAFALPIDRNDEAVVRVRANATPSSAGTRERLVRRLRVPEVRAEPTARRAGVR